MAVSTQARGWFSVVDLNDGRSLNFGISANGATTQIYNPDTGKYNKDFTTTNLVLTPFLYISGESNDMISNVSSVTWKINNGNATTYGTVGTSSPFKLTINKNLVGVDSLNCVITGTYTDPETGITTKVTAQETITKLTTAGSTLSCILTYPTNTYFYNDTISSVQITATMFCGSTEDTTNVSYTWYMFTSSGWTKITSSNHGTIAGYTGRTITIYPDDVLDRAQFKCIVKDTDSTSGTYNKTAEAVSREIVDLSDPLTIEIYAPSGNILTQGAESTTLRADVLRGGVRIPDNDSLYTNATFSWTKMNKNGVQDTTWGTSGVKTGRSITVLRDEIDIKATFFVEMTQS